MDDNGGARVALKLGFHALRRIALSSLYRNAVYLILSNSTTSLLGFFFWGLMAHRFDSAQVGIASSLMAASGLVAMLAALGMGNGLIRYVPGSGEQRRDLVNNAFSSVTLLAVAVAVLYLAGVRLWSPALEFLRHNFAEGLGFVAASAVLTVGQITDCAFIAQRSAKFSAARQFLASLLKFPLPLFVFPVLGGYGIFAGNYLAILITLLVFLFWFMPAVYPGYRPRPALRRDLLKKVVPYSFTTYLGNVAANVPQYILPLMILNLHGPAEAAYFYIPWIISGVFGMIASNVGVSLFAEATHHPDRLQDHVKRGLVLGVVLQVAALGVVYLLSGSILRFFGHQYAQAGTGLFKWLLLSNLPLVVNSLYHSVNKVQDKMLLIVLQPVVTSVLTLGLSYVFLLRLGLTGVGVGLAVANLVVALLVAYPLYCTVNPRATGPKETIGE